MKKLIKQKIAQDVFTYISEHYKAGETTFQRDIIVDQIREKPYCKNIKDKAISQEVDNQLQVFCKMGILDEQKRKHKPFASVIFNLSELAPTILIEDPSNTSYDKEKLYDFAAEINDRQYRMYSWYTTKFQNLLTVGSFLFAGIVVLISSFGNSEFTLKWSTIVFLGTTAVSLIALAISVGVGLTNLIPKLTSKIGGNEDNIRSLIGMKRFLLLQKKLGKTENGKNFYPASSHYYDDFKNLNEDQRLKFTVFQCIGMGKNNLKSEIEIRIASILMIIAFVCGIISIIFYGLNFIF